MNEMRKLMEQVEALYEEELDPVANRKQYAVKLTGVTDDGSADLARPDVQTSHYDIMLDGEKVGELSQDDYFGNVRGVMHNKDIDITNYGRGAHPEDKLKAFLSTKTGARWASNINKYKDAKHTNDYRIK